MILLAFDITRITAEVVLAPLCLALFLAFIRLVRGPLLPDRVIALDLIGSLAVGFIAVFTVSSGQTVYLRAAIVLALLSFLGTIGFAYYIEKRGYP